MNDPYDLLGVALLRVDLAMDALANARGAVVAAAGSVTARETARLTIEDDGWPQTEAEFGKAIRKAREACGMTRKQLATRIGVVLATIRNVELGYHRCNSTTRALLIKALVQVDL